MVDYFHMLFLCVGSVVCSPLVVVVLYCLVVFFLAHLVSQNLLYSLVDSVSYVRILFSRYLFCHV